MSYLQFNDVPFKGKTRKISVSNSQNGVLIGMIKFYPQWRKYVFYPETHTLLDMNCLTEISDVLTHLIQDRKK